MLLWLIICVKLLSPSTTTGSNSLGSEPVLDLLVPLPDRGDTEDLRLDGGHPGSQARGVPADHAQRGDPLGPEPGEPPYIVHVRPGHEHRSLAADGPAAPAHDVLDVGEAGHQVGVKSVPPVRLERTLSGF